MSDWIKFIICLIVAAGVGYGIRYFTAPKVMTILPDPVKIKVPVLVKDSSFYKLKYDSVTTLLTSCRIRYNDLNKECCVLTKILYNLNKERE